jgi:hypothetical protein
MTGAYGREKNRRLGGARGNASARRPHAKSYARVKKPWFSRLRRVPLPFRLQPEGLAFWLVGLAGFEPAISVCV